MHDKKDTSSKFIKDEPASLSAEKELNSLTLDVDAIPHCDVEGQKEVPQTKILIEDQEEAESIFSYLINIAETEILILFPSTSAFIRQKHIIIHLLNQPKYEKTRICIMSPLNQNINNLLSLYINKENNNIKQNRNIIVREIAKPHRIKSTILMVDKKFLLTTELSDDSKGTFKDASGLSTFSTSKPTVLSYISIFDSLWNQAELYDNLRTANLKLIKSEQIEREFINTAAHELRTPTQAIAGYSEMNDELFDHLLTYRKDMDEYELERIIKTLYKYHASISKNATRLESLINNLLDVARIDSHQKNMIALEQEKVDLVIEIKDLLNFQLDQRIKEKNIKVNFINEVLLDEHYYIHTDRSRLNQVLNNLIDNAIKFSKKGGSLEILIYENISNQNIKKTDIDLSDNITTNLTSAKLEACESGQVFIAISDSGKGISPSILPRIFEKFITDSDTGTGLGLYISKKLIEAMGGKIWAFNNKDGIGSTFIFSLPILETIH